MWHDVYLSQKNASNMEVYERCTIKLKAAPFASTRARDIRPADLMAYLNSLVDSGLTRTVQMVRMSLRQVFGVAVDNRIIAASPADRLKMPAGLSGGPKRRLARWEMEAIASAMMDERDALFLNLLLLTGLRKGEAVALTVGDVDFPAGVVHVTKTAIFPHHKPFATIMQGHPKTSAGIRDVPMPAQLGDMLMRAATGYPDGALLFRGAHGGPMSASGIASMWRRVLAALSEAAGRPVEFSPHILRHNYASVCAGAGMDIKTLQRVMGHESVAMLLDIYTHADVDMGAAARVVSVAMEAAAPLAVFDA
jgi:integrase